MWLGWGTNGMHEKFLEKNKFLNRLEFRDHSNKRTAREEASAGHSGS
jgi:hypothetical protein